MPQVSFFFLQNKRWERHIQMTMHFYRVFGHNMTHITINQSEHSIEIQGRMKCHVQHAASLSFSMGFFLNTKIPPLPLETSLSKRVALMTGGDNRFRDPWHPSPFLQLILTSLFKHKAWLIKQEAYSQVSQLLFVQGKERTSITIADLLWEQN